MTDKLNKYQYFNIEKIVQTFAYLQRLSGTTSKLALIKYLFFADRLHLRRHLTLISHDIYYAFKLGPVATSALDVLNVNKEYLDNFSTDELFHLEKIKKINQGTRIINETGTDLLSKNELESLDFSVNTFKGCNLVNISHDYPEWKRYENLFNDHLVNKEPILISDFFTNPDMNNSPALKKYFNGIDPMFEDEEYLQEAGKFYLERPGTGNVQR
ncbi:hypothetical protein AGMMS50268_21840 [Spirochaetia bacterium]|nr:hypothetical protein AGMMS50268_21840 [Spirochaetia bacterium]